MKLKKHLQVLTRIVVNILEERENNRLYRKDLLQLINEKYSVKINQRQLPKVIKSQKQYEYKQVGRNEYEFFKKE